MKYSQKRALLDIGKINSKEFKDFCRLGKESYFTRNRKIPLHDLLFTMINRKGLTLALELRNYMKTAHPDLSISKPGYLKQRMKLNPDAFLELYKYTVINTEDGTVVFETDLIQSGQCVAWMPGETLEPGIYNLQILQSPYFLVDGENFIPLTAGTTDVCFEITE